MNDRQYSKCYVAFLDILGFKDLVNNPQKSCGDILKIYEAIERNGNCFWGIEESKFETMKNRIKMKIMSDSICIYVEADAPNALHDLVAFCAVFQYNLLVDPCVFIRGGITYGDMYAEKDTVFGPALIEAYSLEENNAKVPRIIIRKSTLEHGKTTMNAEYQQVLDNWVFCDDDAFYTLDYFCCLAGDVLQRVNKTVSHWLDTTINESIRQKYLYVKKYIQQRLEEKNNA